MGVIDACGASVGVVLINGGTSGAFYDVNAVPTSCLAGAFGAAADLCHTIAYIDGQVYYNSNIPIAPYLIWKDPWHIQIPPLNPTSVTTILQPFSILRDSTDPTTLLYIGADGLPFGPAAPGAPTGSGAVALAGRRPAPRIPALALDAVTDLPSAKRALEKVVRHANQLAETIRQIQAVPPQPPPLTIEQIRQALQATGTHPLNVSGLPGTLRQNQPHTTP